jgi:hypothetical protein
MTTTTNTPPKKRTAQRLTHADIIHAQQAIYEPQLQTLADEINALRDELDNARATLAKVRASWVYAVQYWATGEI